MNIQTYLNKKLNVQCKKAIKNRLINISNDASSLNFTSQLKLRININYILKIVNLAHIFFLLSK